MSFLNVCWDDVELQCSGTDRFYAFRERSTLTTLLRGLSSMHMSWLSSVVSRSVKVVRGLMLKAAAGMAAAYALGASYPKELAEEYVPDVSSLEWHFTHLFTGRSSFALLCFRLYLLLDHRKWFSHKENDRRLARQV